jgi:hypothetical protein
VLEQQKRLTIVDDASAAQLAQAAHQLAGLERVLAGLLDDFDDFADALSAIAASLTCARIDTSDHPANGTDL